jgi:site-specific DNA-methyltransferase (adenine-specific)
MSELLLGDCLEVMKTLPDCSVDAVVTDPPYGLSFMGKKWDYDVPSVAIWAECLRVLKPGGHLLAFAGTRTQHRMAVRIEDAGFEIRDMIAWVYGSGFPKSLDVSKAIDRAAGAEREVVGSRKLTGTARIKGQAAFGATSGRSEEAYQDGSEINDTLQITAPATPEAQQWAGWGTALKPALEPITVARKPLTGTVAANVLEHGTGALNVDGCRVGTEETLGRAKGGWGNKAVGADNYGNFNSIGITKEGGRWPANLIHDGSDEVVGLFPQQAGAAAPASGPAHDDRICAHNSMNKMQGMKGRAPQFHADTGSAARFFYTAKAAKSDRDDGNTHPTVKPTDLMRYLCRLVTPPGGIVLDPFMGSGSTGKAAMLEGFKFIGIEREASYHAIAEQRIGRAAAAGYQPSLLP